MKFSFVRHTIFPILAAFIWGTAFAFQSMCTDYIPPMTFNALRGLIASITLFIIYMIYKKIQSRTGTPEKINKEKLIWGSLSCGVFLSLATNMQQFGMEGTSAGKAGFITALYIVIVPILGLFLKKRCGLKVWISVAIATAGLYFLCMTEKLTISPSDFYVLICAIFFSIHILVIDAFTTDVPGILLSLGQFIVVTIISSLGMLIFEDPTVWGITKCILPTLYVGVFSSGVAYTLQIISMKGANPTTVSLLLSLESVFSVLGGAVILNEVLSGREYVGCALMFAAVILSQLPEKIKEKI